ncbi:MAG: hypothetical protein NZ872_06475 [Archaeoglobaceae archaeon]|nr:hypothetical protein [Archaeoglobaceae archaeon]MDW8128844.1 hypothetical protein [Archaeoglobaceae archaeon]
MELNKEDKDNEIIFGIPEEYNGGIEEFERQNGFLSKCSHSLQDLFEFCAILDKILEL